jgi:PAS domain S-box-containing protein
MEKTRSNRQLEAEVAALRIRLEEAEETLRAITNNEVDALVVNGPQGQQVFTLQGAEQPYRVFVESMNEGAVTILSNGTILYCNTRFAEMLERPLGRIMGASFFDLLAPQDRMVLRNIVRAVDPEGCMRESLLATSNKKEMPVYLSIKPLTPEMEILCVVVTDLTELKQAEEALRRSKEGLEFQVQERTAELQTQCSSLKLAEDTLKRSLERFAIISDTASQLLMSQTPQLIVEDLCHKVMEHLDCHVFFNFLVDGERNCLRLNAYAGIPEQTAREIHFLDYGVAVCGCAARDACRIVAENIPTTPDIRTDLVRSFGITAYACHPLFAQGQVIGTLSFGTRSRLTFAEDELSLMKTVADQVATAMERIQLLRSAEERGDELEAKVLERTTQLRKQADLLDLAHDAVILSNKEDTISFWNKGAEETYGFTREEAVGKSLHVLLQTKSDIPFKDIMSSFGNEGLWDGELIHTRKDGDKVTVHSRWVLRHDEATGSSEVMEVNRDITPRKRAEKALAMISAYNRSLIETSIDPLATINSQGMISDANIATERVTGYPRDKLIGTDFCDYFTDPTKAKAVYEQVFREETVRNFELEILHKDGRTTPVLYNASVYRNEAGKVLGILATARDVTERRYMEQSLRESEERYRTAIESASDGVTIMRGDQHIYVNKRFVELFGYSSPSEILGKSHSLTVHPDDLTMVSEINMMRQNGEPVPSRYEFRGIRKDGTLRNIEVSATMINYRGEPASLAYLRDITDYKNLEEQLRQSQKMEAIGTLAGGIAHDFNNILAGVIGFAEMVEDDLPPDSQSIHRIQKVLKAAYRGKDLVQQILAFSRKSELTRTPVSLSLVTRETADLLRASLPATIEINVFIKAVRDTILANSAEIQQILMNLATNAAFAMRETGGILGIGLTDIDFEPNSSLLDEDVEPGAYVQLAVTDTGIGMEPHIIKRLFEPYFTTKEVGHGTGMGLPVVYGIVKGLGGTIAVESELGVGSTFRVFLPTASSVEETKTGDTQTVAKGSERILFIDDEDLIMEWGQAALERLGYTVTALTDSTGALKLFSSDPSRFDLVITDQTMPKLTGFNLAKKFLKIRPDIPIILCTGHSDSVSSEKAQEVGIKEFLMKPLGRQELAEVIRRVLDATESKG